MRAYDVALGALRSRPVTALSRRLTRHKLRVIAYHGVPNAARFEAQMAYLADQFTPVSEDAVAAAVAGHEPLPPGAVWVTFDDGDPTVVSNALPTLERFSIAATMYVCPGLIEANDPFWWRVTEWVTERQPDKAAAISGALDLTEHLKTVDDARRRSIVDELLALVSGPREGSWRQLNDSELRAWTDGGMALGNHSWDHPCLDQCSPDAQRDQIRRTHDWLTARLGNPPLSFAYPNGNFSPIVDAVLAELKYGVGVLYDNQLTALDSDPLRLSRLMVEADEPVERLVGVLSGAQPILAKLARRGA